MESVEPAALGDAGVKPVKRESEAVRQVTAVRARNQAQTTSADTRVEHSG